MQMAEDTGEAVEALCVWEPARLGKTPTWSTNVSRGLHSASPQSEWVYGALSYQSVLSSSCHVVAGTAKVRWGLGHSHNAQGAHNAMLVAW